MGIGINLSDTISIQNSLKRADSLSPLLFNFALEYAFTRVQKNKKGLKLNETHQLLTYADDINIVRESRGTVKKTQNLYWTLVRRLV
jgi:hypothetical protein